MARRSKGRRDADAYDIANSPTTFEKELLRPVVLPSSPLSYLDNFLGDDLPFDRRQFTFNLEPEQYTLGNTSHPSPGMGRTWSPDPAFTRPNEVAICHRRQVRKEVMIAKRRRGRGGARRTWRSEIKC